MARSCATTTPRPHWSGVRESNSLVVGWKPTALSSGPLRSFTANSVLVGCRAFQTKFYSMFHAWVFFPAMPRHIVIPMASYPVTRARSCTATVIPAFLTACRARTELGFCAAVNTESGTSAVSRTQFGRFGGFPRTLCIFTGEKLFQ